MHAGSGHFAAREWVGLVYERVGCVRGALSCALRGFMLRVLAVDWLFARALRACALITIRRPSADFMSCRVLAERAVDLPSDQPLTSVKRSPPGFLEKLLQTTKQARGHEEC